MFKAMLYLILFIPLFTQAQDVQPNIAQQFYEIHTYTTKDGLSQVSINDIEQDDEGFLWIATQSGLNRFDGTSFYTFDNTETNSNYINVLLPDHDRIWIGSRATGLSYFDKKAHGFNNIKALQSVNIEGMVMDSMQHLYVTLENKGIGFLRKNIETGNFQLWVFPYFGNKGISATSVFISKSGTLWVGTKEGRLFYGEIKKNPKEIKFHEFPLTQRLEKIFVINSPSTDELWIGTQNKLFKVDLKSKKLNAIALSGQNVSSVIYELKWSGDTLWIGTGAGLVEYDIKKGKPINIYIHSDQDLSSISNNVVYSIFLDQNGQLWAGTGKYLNLFYKNKVFNKIQNKANFQGSLNSNIIFAILKSLQDLWVGTSGGGINLIRNQQSYAFTKNSHGLPSNICFSLLEDQNSIWAGTREGLVIIKDCDAAFQSMQVRKIFHNPKDTNSLSSNFVRYLYKDTKNNIWLCTSGGGLERFTGNLSQNSVSFEHYRHIQNQINSIASDKVNYILETGKNEYWLATEKGLNIMAFDKSHPGQTSFSRLKVKDSTVLDKVVAYTLLKDKDGGIWIGTTNGLYTWKNKSLRFYNVKDGMPDNVVYGILEDFQGKIWNSTNKGLSCFDKQTSTFTNYHQSDGLGSEEYDLHARFIDENGILYFGGIDGITFFDPNKLHGQAPQSKLYIEKIQITNIDKNTIETFHPESNRGLTIRQEQFPITINFSDINLKYYKNTTFAYRLIPANTRWNLIKDKKFIQVLSLPPNDYTLEITGASNGKTQKGDNILKIPISVVPYWWKSIWAYFSYALLSIIVIYFVFRFSLKRKLEHQENLKLKELNSLKSKLYTNITHEFRTPLTVIKGITGEMIDEMGKDEQKRFADKLDMIGRNSDKLLHLVKQMLDMSKIEDGKMKLNLIQDNIISYLQYVLESFQSMADAKNIKLVFYHETEKVVMDYDRDKVFKIASNLLTNAIKFTPESGKIIFHVKKEKTGEMEKLVIKVKDSGIGMEPKDLPLVFDRFYQVDNSRTRKGEGTGIGLALAKELVLLMDGRITVKSQPGRWTEFCVSIPISNQAILQKAKPEAIQSIEGPVVSNLFEPETKENKHLPIALVIEDNTDVAKYIRICLSGKYRVHWSPDGQQGIDTAISTIPDIIISDVMMPVKDGFEVCETLKQDERTSHIPIILLTAKATNTDRIEGLSHGADAYLTKPFNKEELFVRLEQLLKIRRQLQEKYSKIGNQINEKEEPTREDIFLKKAIEIINKNLDNPNLDGSKLASELALSESQLYRKLKAISGKSIAIFIRTVKLNKAKELLHTSNLSVSEIAYKLGFNDPAWFSRVFKEEFGVSPTKAKLKN